MTHLSTLAKNDHGINTNIKPAIRKNGTIVTTKQEVIRNNTISLNICTSTILPINRVGVSVHSGRSTTTTWVDWIREVISKSSFNTSVTSRPPKQYDRNTVSNLHGYFSTRSRTCKIYSMQQITIQLKQFV